MSKGTIVYPVLLRVLVIALVSSPISCYVRSSPQNSQASSANQHGDDKPRPYSGPEGMTHLQLLDRERWLVSDSSQLWRTDDGGHTWIQSYVPTREKGVNSYVRGVSFINSEIGFIIDRDKLYVTNDGENKWVEVGAISARKDEYFIENCFFIDALHGWAVGSAWRQPTASEPNPPLYEGTILATADGGRTWSPQRLSLPKRLPAAGSKWDLSNVLFITDKKGWAIGDKVWT